GVTVCARVSTAVNGFRSCGLKLGVFALAMFWASTAWRRLVHARRRSARSNRPICCFESIDGSVRHSAEHAVNVWVRYSLYLCEADPKLAECTSFAMAGTGPAMTDRVGIIESWHYRQGWWSA